MSSNARAGAAPQIHAQVVAMGMINAGERLLNILRQAHYFRERLGIAFRKLRDMRVGHHHDVAGRIGKTIQDDEREFAAKHNLSGNVIFQRQCVAENAPLVLAGISNVAVAPRSPDKIHSARPAQPWGACSAGNAGAAGAAALCVLTKSFSSLLGLKNGILLGGTSTFAPVFGLRPILPRRCRVRKLPKPRISILSFFCSASIMLSNTVSTTVSDSLRGSSVTRITSSIKSAFVTVRSAASGLPVTLAMGRRPSLLTKFSFGCWAELAAY